MRRSLQEVVELVVFGLIALLIGTGVLWLGGWVLGLVGLLFKFVAGLIWWLLRFIVPVAIVAGLIYFLVRVLQGDRSDRPAAPAAAPAGGAAPAAAPATPAAEPTPSPSVEGQDGPNRGAQVEAEAGTAEGAADESGTSGQDGNSEPAPDTGADEDPNRHD